MEENSLDVLISNFNELATSMDSCVELATKLVQYVMDLLTYQVKLLKERDYYQFRVDNYEKEPVGNVLIDDIPFTTTVEIGESKKDFGKDILLFERNHYELEAGCLLKQTTEAINILGVASISELVTLSGILYEWKYNRSGFKKIVNDLNHIKNRAFDSYSIDDINGITDGESKKRHAEIIKTTYVTEYMGALKQINTTRQRIFEKLVTIWKISPDANTVELMQEKLRGMIKTIDKSYYNYYNREQSCFTLDPKEISVTCRDYMKYIQKKEGKQ